MTNDERPLCLLCGQAMNITENCPDIDLIYFERQKLECPGCGDDNSRFIFVPEKDCSQREIPPPTSAVEPQRLSSEPQVAEQVLQQTETGNHPTNSVEARSAANRAEQPPPQFRFAEPQPAEPQPAEPQPAESQPGSPGSALSLSVEFANLNPVELRGLKSSDVSPSRTLSDVIQSYIAKWHGP